MSSMSKVGFTRTWTPEGASSTSGAEGGTGRLPLSELAEESFFGVFLIDSNV